MGYPDLVEMRDIELNEHEMDAVASKDPNEFDKSISIEGSKSKSREKWSNPVEFLLSCLSFAVGLGNIWRFPFLCYRNGGGAFLIPYGLSMVVLGIPLFFLELSLGQFASLSPGAIWSFAPLFKGLGLSMLFISIGVAVYYNVIVAWAVYYLVITILHFGKDELEWEKCDHEWNTEACLNGVSERTYGSLNITATSSAEEFFKIGMLDVSSGIDQLGSIRWELVCCLLIAWLLVFLALLKGVQSFGKAVYFTALFPYLILSILLIRGLSMDGAVDGILFYVTPQWSRLRDVQVWADAAVQIFFSLGLCFGSLITLASYNRFDRNCFLDAIVISVCNCLTSFFAGFVVFSFVGFMAHKLGRPVDEVVSSGPGLAFIVYPEALSLLPLPHFWSFLFFLMLLALGLGTQFSCVENIVTIILDMWPNKETKPSHRSILTFVCLGLFTAGLTMTTQAGVYVLQVLDNHAATYSALITGLVEIVVVSWVYGARRFLSDIQVMVQWNTDTTRYRVFVVFWTVMWKVFTPLALFAILSSTFVGYEPFTYDGYEFPEWAHVIGWTVSLLPILLIIVTSLAHIVSTRGSNQDTLLKSLSHLLQPHPTWGPSEKEHRLKAVESWHSLGYLDDEQRSEITTNEVYAH